VGEARGQLLYAVDFGYLQNEQFEPKKINADLKRQTPNGYDSGSPKVYRARTPDLG